MRTSSSLVFRLALEAGAAEGVDRVVFLALRDEERHVECFWPVPLDEEPEQARTTSARLGRLRLLAGKGTETSLRADTQKRHRRDKAAV